MQPKRKKHEVVDVVKGFIGLAGPFDITEHYVFESERTVGPFQGVHEISPMKPAVLGIENFQVHSPTALVAALAPSSKRLQLPKFHLLHGREDTVRASDHMSSSL